MHAITLFSYPVRRTLVYMVQVVANGVRPEYEPDGDYQAHAQRDGGEVLATGSLRAGEVLVTLASDSCGGDRERERDRETHTQTHTQRKREREREREKERVYASKRREV